MKHFWFGAAFVSVGALVVSCSGDEGEGGDRNGSPEQTGTACETVDDCFPDVDHADLSGSVLCLEEVTGGYCTHECVADEDCCAAEGECETELLQVCSPFTSTDLMQCFLSCEDTDLRTAEGETAGDIDPEEFCQREASHDFICRSSGGGTSNRKVCVPGDCGVGAACSADADCAGDLECVTGFDGGYCAERGCSVDADCPANSVCVDTGDENLCLVQCDAETDCSFCRPDGVEAACSDEVDFIESPAGTTVCVPPPR